MVRKVTPQLEKTQAAMSSMVPAVLQKHDGQALLPPDEDDFRYLISTTGIKFYPVFFKLDLISYCLYGQNVAVCQIYSILFHGEDFLFFFQSELTMISAFDSYDFLLMIIIFYIQL